MRLRTVLYAVLCAIFVIGSAAPLDAQAPPVQAPPVQAPPAPPPAGPAAGPAVETRVFQIQHIPASSLAETLSLFNAPIRSNEELNTLSVRAQPEIIAAIEDVITRLDTPKADERERAVELTMYILNASDEDATQPVPDALRAVVEQLRTVFTYRSFHLLDTVVLRTLDGRMAQTSGTITIPPFGGLPDDLPTFYNFRGRFSIVTPESGPTALRLRDMRTGFRIPVPAGGGTPTPDGVRQFQYTDVGIDTDVEIPAGQQLVVGKATVGASAMILVMSASFPD